MASKSLTALPSVVSVVAEKTVVALRCHTRGFEKVFWPIVIIILTVGAFICFAVAAGTPMWVQINLFDLTNTLNPEKGFIAFGIFSGSHVIELRADAIVDRDEESYRVFERYTNVLISRLYATFAFSLIAMLLCVGLCAFTFINSYQTVTTWWKGPPMMYILSVLTSLFAFTATALFADFYLWDMDSGTVFRDSFIIPGSEDSTFYLMSYTRVPSLHYSSGLQIGGSFLPVLVILICWRLLVLLPVEKIRNKGEEDDAEVPVNGVPNASILPMTNMAMSMNAAAAGPFSPSSGLPKETSFSGTGDKKMLY